MGLLRKEGSCKETKKERKKAKKQQKKGGEK
jgi:hypothetical protein